MFTVTLRAILLFSPLSVMAGIEPPAVEVVSSPGVMDLGSVVQLVLGLLLVLMMIFASAWLVRRLGRWQGGHADQLKVVGGLALGTRERIVLVQVGEQQLLIGIAPGSIRTLHVLDEPLPVVERGGMGEPLVEKFASILKKQRNG